MKLIMLVGFSLIALALNPDVMTIEIGIGLLIIGGISAYMDIQEFEHKNRVAQRKEIIAKIKDKLKKEASMEKKELDIITEFLGNPYITTMMGIFGQGIIDNKEKLTPSMAIMLAASMLSVVRYASFNEDAAFEDVLHNALHIFINDEYAKLFLNAAYEASYDPKENKEITK